MTVKNYNVLSLGLGVQSSTLALMAKHKLIPMPDFSVFADTGWELPWVYEYLEYLLPLLPFEIIIIKKQDGLRQSLIDAFVDKKRFASIPFQTESNNKNKSGKLRRQCTREFKLDMIVRAIREKTGIRKAEIAKTKIFVNQMIGISIDEATRMSISRLTYIKNIYPLIDLGMSRNDCITWLEKNKYRVPKKSSCIGCPYHDNATWRDMKINYPETFADAVEIDELSRIGNGKTTQRLFIHKSLIPLKDIDFRNLEDLGQVNMFENDCTGLCGV